MTKDDLPRFIDAWCNTQAMFNKTPNDQTLKLVFQSLADFKIEDIERALAMTLRSSKFAPTVADVVEQIKIIYGANDEQLRIKANHWYNALSADIDSYADIITDDPRAVFAFKQCFNSVIEFGCHSAKADVFDRKAFVESYVNARNYDKNACCLHGAFHDNGHPRVRFIGDHKRCVKLANEYYSSIQYVPRLPRFNSQTKRIENKTVVKPVKYVAVSIDDLLNILAKKLKNA